MVISAGPGESDWRWPDQITHQYPSDCCAIKVFWSLKVIFGDHGLLENLNYYHDICIAIDNVGFSPFASFNGKFVRSGGAFPMLSSPSFYSMCYLNDGAWALEQ